MGTVQACSSPQEARTHRQQGSEPSGLRHERLLACLGRPTTGTLHISRDLRQVALQQVPQARQGSGQFWGSHRAWWEAEHDE